MLCGHQELGLAAASNTSGGVGAQTLWALPLPRAPGCCVLADQGHGRLSRPQSDTFSSRGPAPGGCWGLPWGLSAELAEMMAGWGLPCRGLWATRPGRGLGLLPCSPRPQAGARPSQSLPRPLIWGTLGPAGHANGCLFHTLKNTSEPLRLFPEIACAHAPPAAPALTLQGARLAWGSEFGGPCTPAPGQCPLAPRAATTLVTEAE